MLRTRTDKPPHTVVNYSTVSGTGINYDALIPIIYEAFLPRKVCRASGLSLRLSPEV